MFLRTKFIKKTVALMISCVMIMGITPFAVFAGVDFNISTDGYSAVTMNSAKLEGSAMISSEGIITELGVAYSTTQNAPSPNFINGNSTTAFNISVTGLESGKKYYYRTYIKYTDNTDLMNVTNENLRFGPEKDFVTVAPSAPTVNTPTTTTPSGATTVVLSASYLPQSQYFVQSCGFAYSDTNPYPTPDDNNNATADSTTSNPFSKTITNLTVNKKYNVRAYVYAKYNDVYSYYYSPVFVYDTTPVVTITAPTLAKTEATVSSTTVTMIGKITNNGNNAITNNGFVYSTATSSPTVGGANCTQKAVNSSGASFSTTFTGTAGTTYYIRSYAIGSTYIPTYGEFVPAYITSTATKAIPTVTTDTATISGTTITARGTLNSEGNDTIIERGFLYSSTNSTPTYNATGVYFVSGGSSSSLSATITAISGTMYVRAYARNSQGPGYGSTKTITSNLSTVLTESVSSIGNSSAEIYINVSSTGGYSISERGVVYSSYSATPTLSTSSTDNKTVSGGNSTGKDYVTISDLSSNTKYYVRAYAKNSQGTSYGDVKTFTTSNDANANIKTVEVMDITGGGATVSGNIIDIVGTITEKGFAYGKSSSPTISNSTVISTSKSTGKYSLDIDDLSPNTTYYVRAYVKTSKGTSYGDSISFKTTNSASATTNSVTSITESGGIANGSVSNSSSYSITEKGFVYSRTNSTPTISDSKISSTSTSTGTYSMNLTNLDWNTKYYVRAYVKTSQGITYGSVTNFTTKATSSTITVSQKTIYGTLVKTQTITANSGETLDKSKLSIPTGYKIYDASWKHVVSGTTSITVLVSKIESTFMEGVGNYEFAPEQATTRGEVAQIIYNLAVDKNMPSGAKTFTDVKSTNTSKTAIEFCSAKGYMNGFPDGSFRPNDRITRVQISVVLCNVYKLTGTAKSSFKDVKTSYWGYNYISLASTNNMMNGYPDNTFRFDNTTTRAEVCTLFSNAEKRGLDPLGQIDFTDVPSTHWAYKFIMNAAIAQQ